MATRGVALVTGASQRLGRAIATRLAADGMDVVVHFRSDEAGAQATCAEIRAQGRRATALCADLTDAAACVALVGAAELEWGPLTVLVNNAAVFEPSDLGSTDPGDFDRQMATNARPVYLLSREAGRRMRGGAGGAIVNIADVAGERAWPGHVAYSASKAAVISLTRGMALALAPQVRVNAVSPGPILPPAASAPGAMARAVAATLLQRAGRPDEIAAAVSLLVASPWLTGVVLAVDGGRSLA